LQHPAAHHVRRAEARRWRRRDDRRGAFEGEAAVGGVEEEPVVTSKRIKTTPWGLPDGVLMAISMV